MAPAPPTLEAPVCQLSGRTVVEGPWGSEPGQFGLEGLSESLSGAAAFDVSADGRRIYMLDAPNRRLQIFERGRAPRLLRLPDNTGEDLRLLPSGQMLVLAPARDRVLLLDAAGKLRAEQEIGVFGADVRAPGMLEPSGNEVWLRMATGAQRVLGPANVLLNEDESRFGVPSSDGSFSLAVELVKKTLRVTRHFADKARAPDTVELAFDFYLVDLEGVVTDARGRTYFVVPRNGPPRKDGSPYSISVVDVLEPDFRQLRRFELAPSSGWPTFRRAIAVTPDGTLFQPASDTYRLRIQRYDWQAAVCPQRL